MVNIFRMRHYKIFLLGLLVGFIFTYFFEKTTKWSNTHTFILGVPLKIIIAWAVSLLLLYIITDTILANYGNQFKWGVYIPAFFLVGVVIEYIGFHILKIQPLNNLPPLIPSLDIWHGSPWLFFGYGLVALAFIEIVRNIEPYLDRRGML